MNPKMWFEGAWWPFPAVMCIVMALVMLTVVFLFCRRMRFRPPDWNGFHSPPGRGGESALEALEKRYARGEIGREEFLRIKKDLEE